MESCKVYFPKDKLFVLSGVMRDKDYRYIAGRLSEIADRAFTLTPDNPRALPAEEYAEALRDAGMVADSFPSVEEALLTAMEEAKGCNRTLVCFGSLYTYVDVMKAIKKFK